MRNAFKSILPVVFWALPAWTQVLQDTAALKVEPPATPDTVSVQDAPEPAADSVTAPSRNQQRSLLQSKDEDGSGVDDSLEIKEQRRKRGKDKFIDMDGDGICDGRESGLGFRHGKTGSVAPGREDKGQRGKQKQARGGR